MAPPPRPPLIFNPKARSQRGQRALRFVEEMAGRVELFATTHEDEARELAQRFAASGTPVVIAAGGDGTVNAVVRGLAGSNTALAILPTGTMNVFARELGIPLDNLAKAFAVIERGWVRDIDLFEANQVPFVQMAGIGFDATVIERTTWKAKKSLGPLAYLLAAVRVLGEHPPQLEVVCADGRRESGVAVLAGNGTLYGGPFKFFRKADNQDSMLDVLVYKEAGYRLVLDLVRGLAAGGVDLVSSARYLQTAAFVVRADGEVPVEVDGELLGRFREIHFAEARTRLRVIAPEVPDPPRRPGLAAALNNLLHWPWRAAAPAAPRNAKLARPAHKSRRWRKRLWRAAVVFALVGGMVIAYANITATWASRGRLFDSVEAMPNVRVGLVFGTTDRINGLENLYFRYRIDAATKLWHAGKLDTLIVSGDNSQKYYNEPAKMRQALIERGIPAARIVCDQAGLRTLDSVVRAKEIFSVDSIVFISQRFQNQRAIYLAQANGINAIGFNARDVDSHGGLKTKLREVGARVKMWLDVHILGTRPKHLGDKIALPG